MTCKSTRHRRNLREWTLREFGNGICAPCAGCGVFLTIDDMTLDRYPQPGKMGGMYTRRNVRPMCGPCNSDHVDEPDKHLTYQPFAELLAG